MKIFSKIITFLKEVKVEIKKVDYPTLNQTIKYTLIVIGISLFVAIFLGGVDFLLITIFNKFLLK